MNLQEIFMHLYITVFNRIYAILSHHLLPVSRQLHDSILSEVGIILGDEFLYTGFQRIEDFFFKIEIINSISKIQRQVSMVGVVEHPSSDVSISFGNARRSELWRSPDRRRNPLPISQFHRLYYYCL